MFWGPSPQPRDAPPSAPQPPILASAPSLPGGAPCWPRPRPPPSQSAPRAPGLPRGLPGRGGGRGGAGRGRRVVRHRSSSSRRRLSGPRGVREAGSPPLWAGAKPFVPSKKFACRDRDSCWRGGRPQGRRRGGEKRRLLVMQPTTQRLGVGDLGGVTHRTRDSAARGTN